jgi:hypothetical protein
LRAGLLSQPQVIEEINYRFVTTWTLIDDAIQRAQSGDPLAKTLADNWERPVGVMFLTPDGQFHSKLNSLTDFTDVHPDVAWLPVKEKLANGAKKTHAEVFLDHVARHFGSRESH